MRCHICDSLLSDPSWNSDHKDFDPCETCKQVVQDILNSYKDRPAPDEDELPGESLDSLIYKGWVEEPDDFS